MKNCLGLVALGICLVGYSLFLAPYKDEQLFLERYMAMSPSQSEEYRKLRDEMLTPKYEMQDYGGTLAIAGVCGLLIVLALRPGGHSISSMCGQIKLFHFDMNWEFAFDPQWT